MPPVCTAPPTPDRSAGAARRERATATRREDPRRALGRLGEDLAAEHLDRLGFATLARNVRTRQGEIDLIVFDGCTLAFVEVKTRLERSPRRKLGPEEQPLALLRARQCARVRRAARAWLSDSSRARPTARTIRFDAIGVIVDRRGRLVRLDHVEAAW